MYEEYKTIQNKPPERDRDADVDFTKFMSSQSCTFQKRRGDVPRFPPARLYNFKSIIR